MKRLFLAALFCAVVSATASGDDVVKEDFESYEVGTAATKWTPGDSWVGGQRFLATVAADEGPAALFGSDKYAQFTSQKTGYSFVNNDAIVSFGSGVNPIATLSFDMIVPKAVNEDGLGYLRIFADTDNGSRFADVALAANTGDETIEYRSAEDVVVHYDFVVDTVAGAAKLYANGELVVPEVGDAITGATKVKRLSLWANNQGGAEADSFYVDNVVIKNKDVFATE